MQRSRIVRNTVESLSHHSLAGLARLRFLVTFLAKSQAEASFPGFAAYKR
jgi:hypothetical protein